MVWDTQLQETKAIILERGRRLAGSLASIPNKLRAIQQWIKPAATYPLSLALFTMTEIAVLDRTLASVAKMCAKLPKGFSTSGTLRSHEDAGLGVESLMIDYAQICASNLTRALRDPGMLGSITRALLKLQVREMGGAPVEHLSTEKARFCTLLRQATIITEPLHG